jgi:hypothetical protein
MRLVLAIDSCLGLWNLRLLPTLHTSRYEYLAGSGRWVIRRLLEGKISSRGFMVKAFLEDHAPHGAGRASSPAQQSWLGFLHAPKDPHAYWEMI